MSEKLHIKLLYGVVAVLVVLTAVNVESTYERVGKVWNQPKDFFTFLVAVSAALAVMYQGWIMRKHNHASLKPLLHFSYSSSQTDGYYALSLRNEGKGPAIVRGYAIRLKDHDVHHSRNRDFNKFAKSYLGNKFEVKATFFESEDVIGAESEHLLVGVHFEKGSASSYQSARRFVLKLVVEVDYTDLYENKFDKFIHMFKKDIA